MRRISAFILALNLIFLTSCSESETIRQIYVMDSVADIRLIPSNEEAADEICQELFEIDEELSAYDGAIARINENGGGEMSEHIQAVYTRAAELCIKTGGAFLPSLGAVIELWGIGSENRIPSESEINSALEFSDMGNIRVSGNTITIENGARLSFGAIAKGYASDRVRDVLQQSGVEGAVISLGGNVYVHGKKQDGESWRVAIRDPEGGAGDWLGSLELTDKFVISSGDYERYFEYDGKRYHHIIDPKTGYPAESDLSAVAVICDNGAQGDAYSTALYVMGREKALEFWHNERDFELVLVGKDGRVTVTEGIAGVFTPNGGKRYTYETANR